MTLEDSVRMQGWNMNDWHVVIAKALGWNEAGWVIMWATVLAILAFVIFYGSLLQWMLNAASRCKYNGDSTDGFPAAFWYLLMLVPLAIALVLEVIVAIGAIWAGYIALKSLRNWWHKEM